MTAGSLAAILVSEPAARKIVMEYVHPTGGLRQFIRVEDGDGNELAITDVLRAALVDLVTTMTDGSGVTGTADGPLRITPGIELITE